MIFFANGPEEKNETYTYGSTTDVHDVRYQDDDHLTYGGFQSNYNDEED